MIHMSDTVVIQAPIDVVFDYLTDFGNTAKWHKGMKKVGITTPGPVRVGTQYDWVETFAGKTLDLSGEITSIARPNSFTWRPHDPPFTVSGGWRLESTSDGGTRVTRDSDTELNGWMKVMQRLLSPMAKRQVTRELAELKRLIEATQPS
jgi:uncharacterized membrane protein